MVKFVLKKVVEGCRSGELIVNDKTLQTPMCMLYTRAGCVPHLTKDIFTDLTNLPAVAQMPLNLLAEHSKTLSLYKDGLASFTAMKVYLAIDDYYLLEGSYLCNCCTTEFLIYTSLQDSAETVPSGYNSSDGVSVWRQAGKLKVDVDKLMCLVDACVPDLYQSLADSDTSRSSSIKRVRRAVDRTIYYLDRCIDIQKTLPRLSDTQVIGVVQGGYDVNERRRSAEETAKRSVAGFSLEGFHSFGPAVEHLHISDIEDILSATLCALPADRPRLLPGCWSPSSILREVRLGVDVFDSSYPYTVTSRGSALVFRCTTKLPNGDDVTDDDDDNVYEISLKDKRLPSVSDYATHLIYKMRPLLNLPTNYMDDCEPILTGCTCYTCRTQTRAYVHHLVDTSELLASVLLMIHNLHHYFAFFQTIRDAILSDINLSLLEHQLRSYEQQQPINDELQSGVTESSQSETNILSCDQKQTVMDELQSCDVV